MIFELFLTMILPLFVEAFDCNFKFHKIYEEIHFSINSTIILSCVPKFDNDIEICKSMSTQFVWFHNNTILFADDNRRRIDLQGQRLVIFYAQSSDTGKYMCDSENKDGPINRTFVLSLIAPGQFHSTIVENVLPRQKKEEKKDHIYWLPEMLQIDVQQNNVKNSLEEQRFEEAYYVSVAHNDLFYFRVQWYFEFEGSDNRTLVEGNRYRQHLSDRPCNSLVLLPRNVSGLCYYSTLIVPDLNYANQGYYHSVATLTHSGRLMATRNLTYSLRINRAKIDKPHNPLDGDSHMTFNLNSKACHNDYFDFNCSVSPDGNYYTAVYKILPNSSLTMIAETEMELINITGNDGQVISEGNVVQRSAITYRIRSLSFSDSGVYLCKSVPINQMTSTERGYFELRMQMELIVQLCTVSLSSSSPGNWHTALLWPLIAISSMAFVLALWIVCYHYYFQSYLVKTVIVQHPNKLYIPHDISSSPLVLPHVTIKTSHRFRLHRDKPGSQQKPLSRNSVTPLSEKLTKYFQKSCIFNYRPVDASGSSPVVDIIGLSNPDSSKSSSNSTREDSQSQDIILQNNSHTQYRLPSNIGWVFSRDSLIIGTKIGEGAFGIVYDGIAKIMSTRSPVEVAIKTLHDSFGDEDLINLVKEMEIMKLIGYHRHIIGLYGAYVDNGHPYMVMELAKNGNLRDFLRGHRTQTNVVNIHDRHALTSSSITVLDLLKYSLEIASGMEFLSSKMIIHRDLAARNILVDQFIEMKIADFGLTRAVENYYRKSTDGRLPIKWMAPECLLDRVYTVKSDVWSFGIVLWEIFTLGQTPYPTVQPDSMHQALRNGQRNEKPPCASDEIYAIMLAIWNDDPIERPGFSELTRKLSQIRTSEQVSSMQVVPNDSEQSPDKIDHSQCALVKDYLEISSNQCYSTTNV